MDMTQFFLFCDKVMVWGVATDLQRVDQAFIPSVNYI